MAQGKKQQRRSSQAAAARAVASARGSSKDTTRVILAVVAVVVVAVVVIGGVLLFQNKSTDSGSSSPIPALTAPGSSQYPAQFDKNDATVLVGKPTAKVTIDLYEDFLCPYCGEFESTYFNQINQNLQSGAIKVRYHMLNLLDSHSSPPGYSTRAANTALAVAEVDPAKFIDFHYSLFQKQPGEGSAGYSQAQLTGLANKLGVSGSAFDKLISDNAFAKQIGTNTTNAGNNQALWEPGAGGFGTPTIASGGKLVDTSSANWLNNLVKSAS